MKLALTAASLILVAGGAVGCGGDDGGGDGGGDDNTASKADFCGAFEQFYQDLTSVTEDEADLGKVLKDAAENIRDVGTPEDIPDDAKEGLELTLDAIDELPDDATADDIAEMDTQFSEEEKEKTDAFSDYLEKTCPDIGTGS
jgi:hypothetical protein